MNLQASLAFHFFLRLILMRDAFNLAKVRIRHRFRGLPIRGRYCFLHVPKTAGASIFSYIFGRDLGHFRYANLADVAAGRTFFHSA